MHTNVSNFLLPRVTFALSHRLIPSVCPALTLRISNAATGSDTATGRLKDRCSVLCTLSCSESGALIVAGVQTVVHGVDSTPYVHRHSTSHHLPQPGCALVNNNSIDSRVELLT